jgi:hypothetical protein
MDVTAAQGPEIGSEVVADPILPQRTIVGVAYDVKVVSQLLGPFLASTARTPSHAVTAADQRTVSLCTSVCAAVDSLFVPLGQETFGGWSGMASHQVCFVTDCQVDHP